MTPLAQASSRQAVRGNAVIPTQATAVAIVLLIMVLWMFEEGKRCSVTWIRNTLSAVASDQHVSP